MAEKKDIQMTEPAVAKSRSAAIDMIKGLSILSLFFLHFENGWMNLQYNFFIVRSPAFYMVVGWLWGMSSKKRSLAEHWGKRKKGLVIPYLWFSLIFIILDLILLSAHWIDQSVLYRDIYKTLCLRGIGTLWFLPALLGGELLFIYTRDKGWLFKSAFYLVAFLVIIYYNYWNDNVTFDNSRLKDIIHAPFNVIMDMCNAFIYISIAYYISVNWGKNIFNAKKSYLFIIGTIGCVIGFVLYNFINYGIAILAQINFMVFNCFAGLGMLLLFRSIEKFKPFSVPLQYYGKNSLIVMTMHWFLYILIVCIDIQIFHYDTYAGFRTVLYFLAGMVVLTLIIELINRKFKFIIGK